ncbi:PREDICTED: uncharacterized protein LOC107186100 [Dufourea novaeangliae]|uniref:uncharacterized protein LOC107186100 n=1 Tax=Dufourea novaeangliae TaxID=178035 RepID=UPI0007677E92|nr:PREDICTED: uncharacterized protein LOC107186100 [Dufourea novaeangliae]
MKRNINEGCDGCVKNIRSSSATSSEEILDNTKLNIVLTNKGLQIYGTWSKTKLLNLLTHKLKQCVHSQLKSQHLNTKTINEKRLWITIHSGLYSISVLRTLQEKSMSIHTIIKAMKLGLISLNPCELSYFKCFNVDPYILELKDMWTSKFNNVLISNLRAIGLSEPDSWRIIVYGVGLQSSCILCYLLLSGIDIPGIVNWQSPTNHASHKILKFLEHIGIEEDVIQLVEKYGIDEETEQMLIDIGLDQIEEIYSHVGA